MKRYLLAALLLLGTPLAAHAQAEQQRLVDRSALAVQEIVGNPPDQTALNLLRQARAVMICPRLFKAGFIIGAQGGSCVLLARGGDGSWSAPAFYSMGSGSIGFQIGVQDSAVMMVILTERGFSAVMDDQFKLGADASVAVATVGAGLEGATTAALHADIVAFARTRGLFAGVSLSGALMTTDTAADRAYYGRDLAARQIVVAMQANNPGANPLRATLMRYGNTAPARTPSMPPPVRESLSPSQAQPAPHGAVDSAPLPPAR